MTVTTNTHFSLVLDESDRRIEQNLVLREVWIERELHLAIEDKTMGGPSEVEHPELIALGDPLPPIHSDLARRDLRHPDTHEAHRADVGVVGLNHDHGAVRR